MSARVSVLVGRLAHAGRGVCSALVGGGLLVVLAGSAYAEPATPSPSASPEPFSPYSSPSPRVLAPPDRSYGFAEPQIRPTWPWFVLQLVPSPEIALGRVKRIDTNGIVSQGTETAFGLRWQVTPVLWSFGVNRRLSGWRAFVVDPLARNSGSVELDAVIEYIGGHVDRVLVRPGVHTTLPVIQRGEYLSVSLGTSIYQYDNTIRLAYDVGAYVLSGVFGAQVTLAPAHAPLTTIATLRLRYF